MVNSGIHDLQTSLQLESVVARSLRPAPEISTTAQFRRHDRSRPPTPHVHGCIGRRSRRRSTPPEPLTRLGIGIYTIWRGSSSSLPWAIDRTAHTHRASVFQQSPRLGDHRHFAAVLGLDRDTNCTYRSISALITIDAGRSEVKEAFHGTRLNRPSQNLSNSAPFDRTLMLCSTKPQGIRPYSTGGNTLFARVFTRFVHSVKVRIMPLA